MLNWFTKRRRRKLTSAPFPQEWRDIVERNFAHYCILDGDERRRLHSLIQVFIAEKHWEGAGKLELSDEIRVTISAQACLLLLGLPHDYYRNVESIVVYPSTVVPPQRKPGFFEIPAAPLEIPHPIIGEAFSRGPVIIIWDAALHGGRHPESGRNIVYHEFAHKLDMLDGTADGTPPLRDRDEYRRWVEIFSKEYVHLKRSAEKGMGSFLDEYGSMNEAEFFAVATELFFGNPRTMMDHAPDLYRALEEYFRQDPLSRVLRKKCV